MEEAWIVERARLRDLLNQDPQPSVAELCAISGRSERWVRKWRKRLAGTRVEDEEALHSQSRSRHTPPRHVEPAVVEVVIELRNTLPRQYHRVVGSKTILYHLHQREDLKAAGYYVPTSTSTIWRILDEHQQIVREPAPPPHEEMVRPDPMEVWEIDFTDVLGIPPTVNDKQQHRIEVLNIVDRGTSILVDSQARGDFNQATALTSLASIFFRQGLPRVLVIDRDPRFVGSWSAEGYPSALMRFVLSLGIRLEICPPHRPDRKPYVERVHRTLKQECLRVSCPTTVDETQIAVEAFQMFYNTDRPHQGTACRNQPPYVAFPSLLGIPRLPTIVDPDHWLIQFHHHPYKRRVRANGTVTIGRQSYYVSRALAGRYAVLTLDALQRCFTCRLAGTGLKSLPVKGLVGEPIDFDLYFDMMAKEAQSEWQLLIAAQRLRKKSVAKRHDVAD